MKIAVIGPGAMGLLFGSYLSHHHDVTLVGTNPANMQSITENGVTIRETDGSERIYRPHATADTTGLSPVDLVIVQVKASASEAALTKNKALIGPDTILMTLQNGMGVFGCRHRRQQPLCSAGRDVRGLRVPLRSLQPGAGHDLG